MRVLFLILSVILISLELRGQYQVPDIIFNGSILVEIGSGYGSGFFIQDSSEMFFITARHVIFDIAENPKTKKVEYKLRSDTVKLNWYARQADVSNINSMTVDLKSQLFVGNLAINRSISDDFLVLRIAKLIPKEDYTSVSYSSFVKRQGPSTSLIGYPMETVVKFDDIHIGDDIVMVGYPKSLGLRSLPQYDFDRPLLRKGIIAGKDFQLHNIIVDCPSFGGNSGGAIFELFGNAIQSEFKLIGIVSAFIPYEEVWVNPNYGIKNVELANSGYSVIIPIDKAIESIKRIKTQAFQ